MGISGADIVRCGMHTHTHIVVSEVMVAIFVVDESLMVIIVGVVVVVVKAGRDGFC